MRLRSSKRGPGRQAEAPKRPSVLSKLFQFSNLKYVGRAAFFLVGASLTYQAIQRNSNDNNMGEIGDIEDLFSLMQPSRQKADIKVTSLHDKMFRNIRSIDASFQGANAAKAIAKAEDALIRKFDTMPAADQRAFMKLLDQTLSAFESESSLLRTELQKATPDEEVRKAAIKSLSKGIIDLIHNKAVPDDMRARMMVHLNGLKEQQAYQILRNLRLTGYLADSSRAKVLVLNFNGDMMASSVSKLREEVTAILLSAKPSRGDRVVLRLNSPGGTVSGYGLAAAQLTRLKEKGIHLTVYVDEMAASGGYLMASVADEIVASPFAIIGSIGVVATIPNFSGRLAREGVSVEEVTAGKYKRTLTPYGKPTAEDRAKVQEDIQAIHDVFKNSIKQHRPNLNVNAVATGETWLGSEALKRGLVDRVGTFDDLLLSEMKQGHAVLEIRYDPTRQRKRSLFNVMDDASVGAIVSWMSRLILKELASGSSSAGGYNQCNGAATFSSVQPLDSVSQLASTGVAFDVDQLAAGRSGLPYTPMMYAGLIQTTAQRSEPE